MPCNLKAQLMKLALLSVPWTCTRVICIPVFVSSHTNALTTTLYFSGHNNPYGGQPWVVFIIIEVVSIDIFNCLISSFTCRKVGTDCLVVCLHSSSAVFPQERSPSDNHMEVASSSVGTKPRWGFGTYTFFWPPIMLWFLSCLFKS